MAFPRQQWLQYIARLVLGYDAALMGIRIPMILGKYSNLVVHENASWAPRALKIRGAYVRP